MTIKQLRISTNMTQKEFAERFHFSLRTLQEWEQNRTKTPEYAIALVYEILCKEDVDTNNFNIFKSQIKHKLKSCGDKKFLYEIIVKTGLVKKYFENKEYNKSLYLLAFVDTLCLRNNIPVVEEYDEYRRYELLTKPKQNLGFEQDFLPEFLKYNIYEVSIDDAF